MITDRSNPVGGDGRRESYNDILRVGCGAGYQGDRVPPAIRLINEGKLDYLVLECLAERTLTDSIRRMKGGGKGYDPRLHEWMTSLLPAANKHKVTIITNMGAADPKGAGEEALEIANSLGLKIRIVVVQEIVEGAESSSPPSPINKPIKQSKLIAMPSSNGFSVSDTSDHSQTDNENWEVGCTYLGADSIIDALKLGADLVIAGRVADPSLFVAPIAYRFGWDLKKDFDLVAQATLAGHVLECGCHLTGGYFAHPFGRNLDFESLSNLSLPFCDVDRYGNIVLGKIEGSGGELSERTCKQQLTYEIGDPSQYITPDIIVDFTNVEFISLSENAVIARGAKGSMRPETLLRLVAKNAGYKSWAEVSYGGLGCVERSQWASRLVHKWMEERKKGITENMVTYLVGYNSLYLPHGSRYLVMPSSLPNSISSSHEYSSWETSGYPPEVRLRFDGLFDNREDAEALGMELQGLGLCGPAGGGGFAFGIKKDVRLIRQFIKRDLVKWNTFIFTNKRKEMDNNNNNNRNRLQIASTAAETTDQQKKGIKEYTSQQFKTKNQHIIIYPLKMNWKSSISVIDTSRIYGRVLLYNIAHSRSGDKGDTANVSLIPYNPIDYYRLQKVITSEWVREKYRNLLKHESQVIVYPMPGIHAFNIVLNFALDGGVCVSRRIDRHGKTLSDLILNQWIDLPTMSNL